MKLMRVLHDTGICDYYNAYLSYYNHQSEQRCERIYSVDGINSTKYGRHIYELQIVDKVVIISILGIQPLIWRRYLYLVNVNWDGTNQKYLWSCVILIIMHTEMQDLTLQQMNLLRTLQVLGAHISLIEYEKVWSKLI